MAMGTGKRLSGRDGEHAAAPRGRGAETKRLAAREFRALGVKTPRTEPARHLLAATAALLELSDPDMIEAIASAIERATTPPVLDDHVAATVVAATGRPPLAREQAAALEAEAILRAFRWRRAALAGALTAPQVAGLLGTSRQTPHDRAEAGALLGIMDGGVKRFPAWQFDASSSGGVVPGLPAVLRALDASPLAKLSWLTRPSRDLDGERPINALRRGEVDRVVRAATLVGTAG